MIALPFAVALVACGVARWVPARAPKAGDAPVVNVLERARVAQRLPGALAVRARAGVVVDRGCVGFRSLGTREPLAPGDVVHLGSASKAMTSALVATFVEAGSLRWEATLAEVFADQALHPGYREVTLEDLATHHARLARDPSPAELAQLRHLGDAMTQRRALSSRVLSRAPATEGDFAYSNLGYILLGAIVERHAGRPFEVLLQRRLFEPLGMRTCTVRPASGQGEARGHVATGAPVPSGEAGDLPAVYSPAGRVRCSLGDWLRFVDDQLRGERGTGLLLPAAHYRRLHTPVRGGHYAFGWEVGREGNQRVLSHGGTNGYWKSAVRALVESREVLLFSTNVGGVGDGAVQGILGQLAALPWPGD